MIHHADTCASRGESYPCPNNVGPYNNGIGMTLPDGKGFIITQWNGWNFGDPDHQNGRSMFAAVSDIFISGCYCVYNEADGKIAYCYPEQYDTSPSDSATEAECATNWYNAPTMAPTSGPASTSSKSMKYTIPAGDLVNTFDVSPPASGGAYQRDETYHCFDVDSNGFPTYVRGKPHTLSLLLSCYYYYYHAYCWSYY